MTHTCDICNKDFKKKWMLERHQKRKFTCAPPVCNRCGRKFSQQNLLQRHMKRKIPCPLIEINVNKTNNVSIDGNNNNPIIDSYNTINNNITHVHNHITIMPFGKEKCYDLSKSIIDEYEAYASLPVILFKNKNLNAKHPENHNVTISNLREKIGMVKTKDGWKKEDLDVIVRDILNYQEFDIYTHFKEKYDEKRNVNHKTENLAKVLNSLAGYLEDDYQDDDIKNMMKSIVKELINAKEMVLTTKRRFDRRRRIRDFREGIETDR